MTMLAFRDTMTTFSPKIWQKRVHERKYVRIRVNHKILYAKQLSSTNSASFSMRTLINSSTYSRTVGQKTKGDIETQIRKRPFLRIQILFHAELAFPKKHLDMNACPFFAVLWFNAITRRQKRSKNFNFLLHVGKPLFHWVRDIDS